MTHTNTTHTRELFLALALPLSLSLFLSLFLSFSFFLSLSRTLYDFLGVRALETWLTKNFVLDDGVDEVHDDEQSHQHLARVVGVDVLRVGGEKKTWSSQDDLRGWCRA